MSFVSTMSPADRHALETPLLSPDRIRALAAQVGDGDLPAAALGPVEIRYHTWSELTGQNWRPEVLVEKRKALDTAARAALAKAEQEILKSDPTVQTIDAEMTRLRRAASLALSDDEVASLRAFPELRSVIAERIAREQAGALLPGLVATIAATDDPDALAAIFDETLLTEHASLIRHVGRTIRDRLRGRELSAKHALPQAAAFRSRFTAWEREHPSAPQRLETLAREREVRVMVIQRRMAWLRQAAGL